jgi:amidase
MDNASVVRIPKTAYINRFASTNAPAVRIASGTKLCVETNDALKGKGRHYFDNATPQELVVPHANPATGPIYVKGAAPGDALEIQVHAINVADTGYITMKPARVTYANDAPSSFQEFVIKGHQVEYRHYQLPLRPMVGVIGTSPADGLEFWAQEAGDHGGNMDAKIICAGSTLLLPVFVDGGLLALGDVHAAMGDGEVFGQGIEIGAEVDATVSVRPGAKLRRPIVILPDEFATIASHEDIKVAEDFVIRDMGELLMGAFGLDALEAWTLIALYGDLQFCQVVNPQKTVRMALRFSDLAHMTGRLVTDLSGAITGHVREQ